MKLTESIIEDETITELEKLGWVYLAPDVIAPDGAAPERVNYGEVILLPRLRAQLQLINPGIS